jgi:HD-GYP domain-containing protein (c-di-GMP phosphodiesterase class II)
MIPVGELISLITAGVTQATVYHREHPRLQESASLFARRLRESLESERVEGVFVGIVEGRLISEGRPLFGPTLMARRLIEAAQRMRTGGFLFLRATTEQEVAAFFVLCADRSSSPQSLEETRRLMAAMEIKSIAPSPLFGDPGWLGDQWGPPAGGRVDCAGAAPEGETSDSAPAVPRFESLIDLVASLHLAAHDDSEIDADVYRGAAMTMVRSISQRPSELLRLTQYPDYDSYTLAHSVRVSLLAVLVARRLGLPMDRLVEVALAGLLHDAGKGKIPHEILFKPGPLDPEERRIMSTHALLGAEVLVRNPRIGHLSVAAAFGHHVRHDRRGYPQVPPWVRMSPLTSLVQVCDVFEALTAVRPYKPSLTPRRAYEIMLKDRGAFDPSAFALFFRVVGLYPPGSRVRLESGEEAMVLEGGVDPERPVLLVTHDPAGEALPEEARATLDLGDPAAAGRRIARVLREPARNVAVPASAYADRSLTIVTSDEPTCASPACGEG